MSRPSTPRCARCQRAAPADARFCPSCGSRLRAGIGLRPEPRHPAPEAPGTRTLEARAALASGRKHVTVLFADVTASLNLLTHHDVEEAATLFDEVLRHMTEAVQRYEGTVNQTLGDGIMALFGAPISHEDHALRACYAALRMQERITAYGDVVQRTHGIPLLIRVGLNSGEVMIRPVPEDTDLLLSVVGQTVHLASRMEQLAKPGTILATDETVALAGSRVRTRSLGPICIKGLAETVQAHEVTGAVSSSFMIDAPRSPAVSSFVGREHEMKQLRTCLEEVRRGSGHFMAIAGEPGIGKTRLVGEFLRECRAEGCTVLGAVAAPYTRATGQRAGMEVIRGYLGVDPLEDAAEIRHRVTAQMRAIDPALEEDVPAMLWQLGALEAGDRFWSLDFVTRRQRAFQSNFRAVAALARRQPVVVVFENLQWIDSDAEDSLKILVREVPPRTLVVVTCRPDYDDAWLPAAGVTRIHLGVLPPSTAARLLDALLGPDPALGPLKGLLIERTGGNPLFLEETVRDLVQSGGLSGERGARRLEHPIATIDVPATVRSVLEARIDRLPADDKHVLQCAAVIGQQMPVSLLELVADLPPASVRESESRLCAVELLEERALFPEPAYAFRHALTHDVAYGSLLHERRRHLHGRVLRALETLRAGAAGEVIDSLAHHAFHGEVWDKAVDYARQAAAHGRAGLGSREAVAQFERALAALRHLPDSRSSRELAIDIHNELCRALVPLGEHRAMLANLREAEALAAELRDDRRLAQTLSLVCNAYWELGNSAEAIESGERAVALAEGTGEPDLQIIANFSLGGAARAVGDYRRAAALLRRNLDLVPPARLTDHFGLPGVAAVLTRGQLAWTLAELGEFREAVQRAEEAIRLAQRAPHAYSLAHAQLGLGGTLFRQGRIGEAAAVLERGMALVKDAPFLHAPMAADLAVVYALSGRTDVATELAERAVAGAERMGRLGRLSLLVTHLGETYLFSGRTEEAGAQGRRALDLAVERGERGNQVYAFLLLGLVAAENDPPRAEEAASRFREALALAEDLGMRPLAARCHLAIGQLARKLGDLETATAHLSMASDFLKQMDMQYWLLNAQTRTSEHRGT